MIFPIEKLPETDFYKLSCLAFYGKAAVPLR
jgi:hypothetical protein